MVAIFDILTHPVYVKLILCDRAHYFMNILFETFFYVVNGLDAKELLQSFGTIVYVTLVTHRLSFRGHRLQNALKRR